MRSFVVFLHGISHAAGFKILASLLLGLVLFGVASGAYVWAVVVLFLVHLTAGEALKLIRNLPTGEPGPIAGVDGDPVPGYPVMAQAERRDAILKITAWWITLPSLLFAAWAWFEPIVGWYQTVRLPAALIVGVGMAILAWPDRAFRWQVRTRTIARSLIATVMVVFAAASLQLRHPYVFPGFPDANRVRAERLLATTNIVAIQHHSGVLVAYAAELERSGQIQKAGDLLNLAARADNTNPDVQQKFAEFLTRHGRPGEDAAYRTLAADLRSGVALKSSSAEYDFDHRASLRTLTPDGLSGHAVILIGDSDTPAELLDIVGTVLAKELGVNVYRLPQVVNIAGTTRSSGLLSKQILIDDAWKDVLAQLSVTRRGPQQRLVVTARDLFGNGSNFIYSSPTTPGDGIISYARLGNVRHPCSDRGLLDNLCKQALSTVIKSLVIYPSPDPRDVTAYVNGGFQLSRKGRRPLPATLTAYHEQIRRWEAGFQ